MHPFSQIEMAHNTLMKEEYHYSVQERAKGGLQPHLNTLLACASERQAD
jgi:hypothetical protein